MSPLAAIRQVILPDPRATLPVAGPGAGAGPGPINPAELSAVTELRTTTPAATGAPTEASFGQLLTSFVQEVNNRQIEARGQVAALQSGQGIPLHQVVIAMEEASVSFQLMVEVRNKLLEAYQEMMRMQM